MADPLHKFGNEGAWVHVDSGWKFPQGVGDFARVAQPYNIDGNNDAGAEYRHGAATIELEIYAADSAATDATLDGAKATAMRKAGQGARVLSEEPFEAGVLENAHTDGGKVIKGAKIIYATDAKTHEARSRLYYFTTDQWRVLVRAATQDDSKAGDSMLDEFVRALPWDTLGSDSGLH
ncbi:hypothetical protein JM946_01005 [Steroidobacter sp. S1-65]|uniref:DUF1795 domain-containing protein n=1 Tax=Steroidobacter gossypii TaxID=2805490 RepID=A0ABS1WQQ5_9GAMM|nr:hypothetical protein [Steroidobacter gossypii]MBM0103296.1 hypothetical protein [Steroidobacter gossypii]